MNDYRGFILGFIWAAITIAFVTLIPEQYVFDFLAVLLALIAGVYLGFAIADGKMRGLLVQGVNIFFIMALILVSLLVHPYFLAAGYFAHGIWDMVHHSRLGLVHTKVPELYIHACMLYDWIIGAFILLLWR